MPRPRSTRSKKICRRQKHHLHRVAYQNTLTADRGQEIRSLANYYEELVNLAQQEGSTLERNQINIEVK